MSWISDFAGKAENLLNKLDNNAATLLNNEKSKKKKTSNARLEDVEPLTAVNVYSNHPSITVNTEHEVSSNASSPLLSKKNIIVEEVQFGQNSAVSDENEMLKNEIRGLNAEINLLLTRVKSSENDVKDLKIKLSKKANETETVSKELELLKQKSGAVQESESKLCSRDLEELQTRLNVLQVEALKREESLKNDLMQEQLRVNELEQSLAKARRDFKKELAEQKSRAEETEKELTEYKTRARKTLKEKERLVEQLKNNTSASELKDHSHEQMELNQLKSELENLSNELERSEGRAEITRKRAEETERLLEVVREELAVEVASRVSQIDQETSRRKIAEENCRRQAEELLRVREDLTRQLTLSNERSREREIEVARLRQQLSQLQQDQFPLDANSSGSRPINNHQARITSLAQALVQKQAALEAMTNDRNQLRLQLERVKVGYNQYAELNGRGTNDTDDAKAQVPGFMVETPFDTRVTRRVKRAYSSLNALSVRSGAFFRRRPVARMFLLFYGVVLHLWVCFVLFSSTPDTKL